MRGTWKRHKYFSQVRKGGSSVRSRLLGGGEASREQKNFSSHDTGEKENTQKKGLGKIYIFKQKQTSWRGRRKRRKSQTKKKKDTSKTSCGGIT